MFKEDSTVDSKKSLHSRMQLPNSSASKAAKSKPKKPNCMKNLLRCLLSCFCITVEDSDEEDDAPSHQPKRWSDGREEHAEELLARLGRPGSPLGLAGHQIATCFDDVEEENTSYFNERISDILASMLFFNDQSEISSCSPTCTSKEVEENLSAPNKSVPEVLTSLGSADKNDPETYSSRVSEAQQEEQAEEPLAIVSRPGSPLGVTGHQSPACPAGEGAEDTCPFDSPSSSTSSSDAEQTSLGSTDDDDSEIYFSCASETQQEEQAEEPLAIVSRPGSPLGVTGHQSPACPAGEGGEDMCPFNSPSPSTFSSGAEQTSLENKPEEDLEMLSSQQRGSLIGSLEPAEAAAEEPIATHFGDVEEENTSHLNKIISDILARMLFLNDQSEISSCSPTCTSKEVKENLSAPNKSVPEVLTSLGSADKNDPETYSSRVVPKSRLENARTLTSEELACYGLPNLCQTCYMNSVLQSLLTLIPFVEELNKQSQQWLAHPKALLFKLLTDINNSFTTKDRKQKKSTLFTFLRTIALQHSDFEKNVQQDAHEFLNIVLQQLSSISTELRSLAIEKRQSYTCPVGAHISFKMLSTMHCHSCGHKYEKMEEFLNLSLVPQDTIVQGMQLYLKEELLDYKCHCGATQTTEKRSFFTLPNVLIIHLMRFKWTSYHTVQKIHRATCLSRELLLNTNQSSEKIKYSLKSIVNHLGSWTTSGHYICDGVFRNANQGDVNDCWITYDDDVVKETTFNKVCQQRQKTAYLLYYERMQKDENQDQTYG